MLLNYTNQTEDDLFSCYSPSVVGYRYLAVLWGCAVTITGTVGNLMTILAFALDPRLRTRFNVLIINLAVADLLYCTILQPISVDNYLHLRWRTGQQWCSAFGLLLFLSNSVSIITLCLIAASRYLLVTRRTLFNRVFSNWGLAFLLTSAWGLGLASFGPLWSVYVFVPQVCTCSFHRTKGRPYTTILLFFYFFIGLGCVGLFYLLIYKRVQTASQALLRYRISRRSSKNKPPSSVQGTDDSGITHSGEMSSQVDVGSNQSETTCETPHAKTQASKNTQDSSKDSNIPPTKELPTKEQPSSLHPASPAPNKAAASSHSAASGDDSEFKRVTRMCFTVFLCFVFCFVPFIFLNIGDKNNRAPHVLHMFCANLTWLNSCINPVLYAVMNRQFRQAYHVVLTKIAAPFSRFSSCCPALSS